MPWIQEGPKPVPDTLPVTGIFSQTLDRKSFGEAVEILARDEDFGMGASTVQCVLHWLSLYFNREPLLPKGNFSTYPSFGIRILGFFRCFPIRSGQDSDSEIFIVY